MTPFDDSESTCHEQVPTLKRDPSSIRFHGQRLAEPAGATVFMVIGGQRNPLPLRLELRNHSPTGFEWGYPGSGPAQLALAMCAEVVDDWQAQRVYQLVKTWLVVTIPQNSEEWELTGEQVYSAIVQAVKVLN